MKGDEHCQMIPISLSYAIKGNDKKEKEKRKLSWQETAKKIGKWTHGEK